VTTVVYPLREDRWNRGLRYSLRSLVNLKPAVERVIVVGYCPSWLTGVEFIPGNTFGDKPRNVFGNILAAVQHDACPDEFVAMNDDFWLLQPQTPEMEHRGRLSDQIGNRPFAGSSWWYQSLHAARDYLTGRGHTDPLSFELHRPIPIRRDHMRAVLEDCQQLLPRPQWRTVYGVTLGAESVRVPDVKITRNPVPPDWETWPSVSGNEHMPQLLGPTLARLFPEPSPWEAN